MSVSIVLSWGFSQSLERKRGVWSKHVGIAPFQTLFAPLTWWGGPFKELVSVKLYFGQPSTPLRDLAGHFLRV